MNRIEEMMKAAGVENDCIDCKASNMIVPDCEKCFTAEKQLEIIKLIGTNEVNKPYHSIRIDKDEITKDYYVMYFIDENLAYAGQHYDFAQALAQLTTGLMKTGELDKEKVKKILQDEI